jgi:hypothetical protein
MSVHGGEAEIICSFRVFRILTHLGHRRFDRQGPHNLNLDVVNVEVP